jgi:hypothetical protein
MTVGSRPVKLTLRHKYLLSGFQADEEGHERLSYAHFMLHWHMLAMHKPDLVQVRNIPMSCRYFSYDYGLCLNCPVLYA